MKYTKYMFTFWHRNRKVVFGPYDNENEAKDAFQRAYGYWPLNAISVSPYEN